jgi:ASC-1-like (ASCH) protein
MRKLVCVMAGTVILGASLGCAIPGQNQVFSSIIAKPRAIEVSYRAKTNRSPTKTATITVEGEKIPVSLRLYDQFSDLFTTYFPVKDFLAQGVSSGEGRGVRFIANFGGSKNENAYVSVAFLNDFKTLGQVRAFINGKRGLIASNGWRVVSRTRNVPYRWAKEKIVFGKGNNIVGNIYLGQEKGKAFYVITHYPVEYGDGFPPRADLILRNLQVGG